MTRVAALDCGTNTLRLLVAEPAGDGGLAQLVRRTQTVRLGQGVDRTGEFAPEALERVRAALAEYAGEIRELGVAAADTRLVATSATRDVSNRSAFEAIVREAVGVDPDVVSGHDEAGLSFAGATRELHGHEWLTPPYLVADIGGGSTELVLGVHGPEHAISLDVGCVRLTERHLAGQRDAPLTAEAVAAAERDIAAALDDAEKAVPLREAHTVLCVAGTATTIAALAQGLASYSSERVHHAHVSTDTVCAVTDRLLASTVGDILGMAPVSPGRADVLTAGALVLRAVLDRAGAAGYTASEHDILDGIAWSLLR